ncbi:MAG: phosphoglycerate kinase [Chitinophagales bacterium]|nr:phosphoglycerate kinase [Bacteroidota bacterium]
MKTVNNLNFNHKKALVRVDFNVPLSAELQVSDNTRIKEALPTLQKILNDGGALVLMSHLGRPKNGPENKFSLAPVAQELATLLQKPVKFVHDCVGDEVKKAVSNLHYGEILLLENLRFHKEEEKGDAVFAKQLADLGADVYVNDAFGTAHRAHASTAIIANYFPEGQKVFGLLMAREIENAQKVLHNAQKPFTAILGGAKVSDKILLIENLLEIADNIVIGGGMTYTFVKAQGGNIGASLCEEDKLDLALELLAKAKQKGVNFYLPEDSLAADAFSNDANSQRCESDEIPATWMGLDIGEKAMATFDSVIFESKTILWNGPMGVFEMEKFQQGTRSLAQSIARATQEGAFSLVGGGDSVAAVKKFDLADSVSFVSTGGGAMLEYFEGKILPGIAAISENKV